MRNLKRSAAGMIGVRSGRIRIAIWLSATVFIATSSQGAEQLQEKNIGGYLSVGHSQVPATFNAGFSFYSAAWPLLEKYPGA